MMPAAAPGQEPETPLPPVTPELVRAAYRRSLRYGTYWRLLPEERAVLFFARFIKVIRSPALRRILYLIFERVWPEKARYYLALHVGLRALRRRAELAAKIGYRKLKEVLSRIRDVEYVLSVGYAVLNTPPFYRGELP